MDDRVTALIAAHGPALLRTARKHSLCADDAHDAYQRALEIYLRRLETVDPRTEGAWMRVVVRHEAMAVRRARVDSVAGEEVDLDARPSDDVAPIEERLASAERSARSAEVLRRLKPDEARALMLKAEGHSYAEIGALHGWTYTKVNRAITEGRRRFLSTYAGLERGDDCDEHRLGLAELARGSASAEAMVRLRPHLRHCGACRATVRELRGGRRRVAGWLAPPAFLQGLIQPMTQILASSGGGRVATVAAIAGVGLSGAAPSAAEPPRAESKERRAAVVRTAERPAARRPAAPVAAVATATPARRAGAPSPEPARRRPEPAEPRDEFGFEAAPRPTEARAPAAHAATASATAATPSPRQATQAEFSDEFLP